MADILTAIAAEVEWLSLPGGSTLFAAGDPSDAMYIVLSGCLGVYLTPGADRRRFVGRIVAGDTVGEMGLVSGRPRSGTVVALRDTELARLSQASVRQSVPPSSGSDATHRADHGGPARIQSDSARGSAPPARGHSQYCRNPSKWMPRASPASS